ncbi:uncharacterized protein LOC121869085 [Homarus americanus]|uniref:uncharacterized protein LOC121869085 n=1 Tax=Homarus americanus TaxID=6706 RepID=UPI001C464573|nr:uncharacterized protein LOC121869085 [Homarus americanus]
MEYLSTTASVIAMICDLSCFKMMVVGAVFTLIWFRLKAQDVHRLLAACKELEVRQKVGRKMFFWPPLLLVLILTEAVLISTWYMEDLTFVSAPRWVVVVVMPIHAINRTTAVFPTLLYIGVTDVLKDYAAYLGGRLETAYRSRDLARTGSRTTMRHTGLIKMTRENDCGTSDGHLDVVVDEAAQELHQLLNLHHQLDKVVSIPLLVSLMGLAISIVGAAFFFSEAASFCEILTLMMTMMLTITLLYVQGYIGDAFHQQLLNVHHVVRQLLNTGLSSHTDAAQDFLVSRVKQLSDEAGDPLEMTIGGLYTLSGSNFLPIVGAVVSNLVILLQFYLPCSNSHGSP